MRDLIRRLADVEPSDLLVISAYLDTRPEATPESPGRRAALTVLRDRLRAIEASLEAHGPVAESFRVDAQRIIAFVAGELDPATDGAAIFGCHGRDLWETVEVAEPFETRVTATATPALYQLARFLENQETAVVAVVDTNTARLFATRGGRLEDAGGPDDDPIHYRKRSTGGWSEARYQRHVDEHRAPSPGRPPRRSSG